MTAKGGVITTSDGHYENSQFYQGEGNYYLVNTCNTWTTKSLRSPGLDISPFLKLSAGSIFSYLNKKLMPLLWLRWRSRPLHIGPGEQN